MQPSRMGRDSKQVAKAALDRLARLKCIQSETSLPFSQKLPSYNWYLVTASGLLVNVKQHDLSAFCMPLHRLWYATCNNVKLVLWNVLQILQKLNKQIGDPVTDRVDWLA